MDSLPLAGALPASPAGPGNAANSTANRADRLMQKAQELEAAFLAEMLGHAGLGDGGGGGFAGGIGEERFASFLRDAQAKLIVARGGIGLAETLFRAMAGGQADDAA